jgi:hypothetical protein
MLLVMVVSKCRFNEQQLMRPFRAIMYFVAYLGLKPQAARKNPSGILEQDRNVPMVNDRRPTDLSGLLYDGSRVYYHRFAELGRHRWRWHDRPASNP